MKAFQLEIGKCYQVRTCFNSGFDQFEDGQVLTYINSAYSPYDDCVFYEFRDESGKSKSWVVLYDLTAVEEIPIVDLAVVPSSVSPGESGPKKDE